MADYIENFASKLDWAMPFQRTGSFPLDRTDLFSSYADAVKYAAGDTSDPDSRGLCGTSYIGQIVAVFENNSVTIYKIESDRTLGQIGSSYELPTASATTLGGVKVGAGLTINEETGVLSATGGGTADSVDWANITSKPTFAAVATSGSYTDLTDKPTIPTALSDLTNDGNFVSDENYVHTDNNFSNLEKEKLNAVETGAQANVQSDWSETDTTSDAFILNKPTKLTDFTNDAGFIDNTVSNLANYYKKTEVNDLIATVSSLSIEVVDALPTTDISSTVIYLVPKEDKWSNDVYDEYIYIASTSKWEMIGNTIIDLTDYLKKDGDSSNTTVDFEVATERTLPTSGAALGVIIGSVVKYLNDLSAVAFSGSYNDLTDKPTVYPHLAIEQLSLAANATSATTITTFTGSTISSVFARDTTTGEVMLVDWHLNSDGTLTVEIAEQYGNALEINISYLTS